MDTNNYFLKQEWLWPVLICAVILWCLFLWKEYRQASKVAFVFRACIALIAILALAVMVLQPMTSMTVKKGNGIILTKNYEPHQLDNLTKAYKQSAVIHYEKNGLVKQQLDTITTAFILGDGIESYDMWQLDNTAVTLIHNQLSRGIHRLKYHAKIPLGDSLHIRGLYTKPDVGTKMLLLDPGGNTIDSATVEGVGDFIFNVATKPKASGLFTYSLSVRDSLNTRVSSDVIPVIVQPKKSLSILILNSFPSFETKYLKNFLAENGHEVLVRSQITKNKYKFENFNRSEGNITSFTESNLENFDVIIMDSGSYLGLSKSAARVLEKIVRDRGLGVFIQPDASVMQRGEKFGFRLKQTIKKETQLPPWPKVTIPIAPYRFTDENEMSPILKSSNEIVSAYYQEGFGRIGTSLASETYPLILEGHAEVYEYMWSKILSSVSQTNLPIVSWEATSEPLYVNEPFCFKLKTTLPNPRVIDSLKGGVALRQDFLLPEQWQGVVYPKRVGWHRLKIAQDTSEVLDYYVFPENSWEGVRQFSKKSNNLRYFQNKNTLSKTNELLQPYKRVWFFIIFVCAMGVLWLVPRIRF